MNDKQHKKIVVIGDGGWGTALALTLLDNGHEVALWGPFPEYTEKISASRENDAYLPGVPLPDGLVLTADRAAAAADADIAVLAMPTKFFRGVVESFAGLLPDACLAVSVAKGFDPDTHQRMTEVAEQALGIESVAALSGPSHAEEVARKVPTAVVVACRDKGRAEELSDVLMNGRFRVYTSDDVVGVQLGGALKNVIAIAAGAGDGIGFGDNTRAAIITRGVSEISRLGCALGAARRSTFAGLSGMGDLIVTCTSKLSRNRAIGERLGRGETLEQILGSTNQAAEGVWNCAVARDLARAAGVEVPITEQVYSVIHEGRSPHEAVESLMTRPAKSELE